MCVVELEPEGIELLGFKGADLQSPPAPSRGAVMRT
jgi:hypothetical protein